jgi:hypothetical protein
MKLKNKSMRIKNIGELKQAITISVNKMPNVYFKKLVASMPKRLQLVLDSKGNMTKYLSCTLERECVRTL